MNNKFMVGDKVKQSAKWEGGDLNPKTFTGVVTDVHPVGGLYPYSVKMDADAPALFMADELELAE